MGREMFILTTVFVVAIDNIRLCVIFPNILTDFLSFLALIELAYVYNIIYHVCVTLLLLDALHLGSQTFRCSFTTPGKICSTFF